MTLNAKKNENKGDGNLLVFKTYGPKVKIFIELLPGHLTYRVVTIVTIHTPSTESSVTL